MVRTTFRQTTVTFAKTWSDKQASIWWSFYAFLGAFSSFPIALYRLIVIVGEHSPVIPVSCSAVSNLHGY
jgi:hypothetical protein